MPPHAGTLRVANQTKQNMLAKELEAAKERRLETLDPKKDKAASAAEYKSTSELAWASWNEMSGVHTGGHIAA